MARNVNPVIKIEIYMGELGLSATVTRDGHHAQFNNPTRASVRRLETAVNNMSVWGLIEDNPIDIYLDFNQLYVRINTAHDYKLGRIILENGSIERIG